VLTGGAGADTFRYTSVGDSVLVLGGAVGSVTAARVGTLEVITDFVRGTDRIDLSAIDARTNNGGDQAFNFLGTTAFNGANSNGGLRSFQVRDTQGTWFTVIEASNDGDTNAEFQIALQGQFTLAASDFVL
jgi:Ca2+-binding RTX toxin-like protein